MIVTSMLHGLPNVININDDHVPVRLFLLVGLQFIPQMFIEHLLSSGSMLHVPVGTDGLLPRNLFTFHQKKQT